MRPVQEEEGRVSSETVGTGRINWFVVKSCLWRAPGLIWLCVRAQSTKRTPWGTVYRSKPS